jgi:hypothetical protein
VLGQDDRGGETLRRVAHPLVAGGDVRGVVVVHRRGPLPDRLDVTGERGLDQRADGRRLVGPRAAHQADADAAKRTTPSSSTSTASPRSSSRSTWPSTSDSVR